MMNFELKRNCKLLAIKNKVEPVVRALVLWVFSTARKGAAVVWRYLHKCDY